MHTPEVILDLHEMLKIALSKMAVLVVYHNNDRFLVSQSKETITPFNEALACYFYSCELDNRTVECYELRYDKLVTIDVREISHLTFIGLGDIAPAIYINPRFKGILPDDKLQALQFENFLKTVLRHRNEGFYIEQPYSSERVQKLIKLRWYMETNVPVLLENHPLFEFLNDRTTDDFYLYSNIVEGNKILQISDRIFYSPAILACYNQSFADISQEGVSKFVGKLFDLSDLKEKWISKLEELKQLHIKNLEKDKNNISDYIAEELRQKLNYETVTQSIQQILGAADTANKPNKDNFYLLQEDLIQTMLVKLTSDNYSIEAASGITHKLVEYYVRFYKPDLSLDYKITALPEFNLINEIILKLGAEVINSALSIRDQYESLLNQTLEVDFAKELEGLDDFRIYLRYWPEFFEISPLVLTEVRSFNTDEMRAIKILQAAGIEIEDKKLDIQYNDWSIFNLMKDKIEIMREKRIKQIENAANQRAIELEQEMSPVYETLSEEERVLFSDMLKDVKNMDRYIHELNRETMLEGVLSYWPLVLYPKPDNIL